MWKPGATSTDRGRCWSNNHCFVGFDKKNDDIGKPVQRATSQFVWPGVVLNRTVESGIATNPVQRMIELDQKLVTEPRLPFLVMQGRLSGFNFRNRENPDNHYSAFRRRCSARKLRIRA